MTIRRFTLLAQADSPWAQSVALALAPRGTDLHWQTDTTGTVALTATDNRGRETTVHDPLAMIELVEEHHPDQPLHPLDPARRARHRELMAVVHAAQSRLEGLCRATTPRDLDLAHHFLRRALAVLEEGLEPPPQGARHPFNNLDTVLAPLIWRIRLLDFTFRTNIALGLPRLADRAQWLLRQDEVQELLTEPLARQLIDGLIAGGVAVTRQDSLEDWSRALGCEGHEKRLVAPLAASVRRGPRGLVAGFTRSRVHNADR